MKYNNIVKRANTMAIDENIEHDESSFKLNFDIEIEKENYQIMYKIAGFCSRSIYDKHKCEGCFDILISNSADDALSDPAFQDFKQAEVLEFHNSINRGGLIFPSKYALDLTKIVG